MTPIKVGDILSIDEEEYEVTGTVGAKPTDYWLKSLNNSSSYFHLRACSAQELENLATAGRLKFGRPPKGTGGKNHWHDLKRYMGLREVYDYCDCGFKKDVSWRDLK